MCTNKKNKPHAAGTCIRQDGLADRITAGKNSFLFIAYVYIYTCTQTQIDTCGFNVASAFQTHVDRNLCLRTGIYIVYIYTTLECRGNIIFLEKVMNANISIGIYIRRCALLLVTRLFESCDEGMHRCVYYMYVFLVRLCT